MLFVAVVFMFSSLNVNAEELTTNIVSEEPVISENYEQVSNESTEEPVVREIPQKEVQDEADDVVVSEIHKVSVIINKTDETGKPLSGATLQILDANGNVVDEWVSNGTSHEVLLPEGNYTLHEVSAPEGYIKASDKTFTVKVEVADLDAGVDWSTTPCQHYGGTPLYYVEINGQKSEVYCINQDWETPDDDSNYDGAVLNPEDIRNYTQQTVYIDADKNKGKIDVSDQSLTSQQLYDKILDIIYHRQLATDLFPDLTEAEIRYVTESALKNYTNAGLTRVQGVRSQSAIPEGATDWSYYSGYYWYLYPWYRSFVYNPDAPIGTDIFVTAIGQGDAFGNLARHWSSGDHNAKNDPAVRAKIARYYELYQYLISNKDHHPSDMHLYIYASNNIPTDLSGNDFDGAYQNLLGVRWFNPYDEDYKVELTLVNYKKDTGKTEIVPPVTMVNDINTNNNYLLIVLLSVLGLSLSLKRRFN